MRYIFLCLCSSTRRTECQYLRLDLYSINIFYICFKQSTEEELVATTAYFELLIRSVTHPGLLYAFIKFLLKEDIDGQRIIDCLIQRISFDSKVNCFSSYCFI